jgi:hypothetical protein
LLEWNDYSVVAAKQTTIVYIVQTNGSTLLAHCLSYDFRFFHDQEMLGLEQVVLSFLFNDD